MRTSYYLASHDRLPTSPNALKVDHAMALSFSVPASPKALQAPRAPDAHRKGVMEGASGAQDACNALGETLGLMEPVPRLTNP